MKKIMLMVSLLSSPTMMALAQIQSTTATTPITNQPKPATMRIPIGKNEQAFNLSDSGSHQTPSKSAIALGQIQLTQQDSIKFAGLFDLPLPSLLDVTSRLDYFSQLRLLRFGMLQINQNPELARSYGAKLFLLSEEIFIQKEVRNSRERQPSIAAKANNERKTTSNTAVQVNEGSPPNVPSSSMWFAVPSLLLLGLAGLFYYDRYINKKKPILFARPI